MVSEDPVSRRNQIDVAAKKSNTGSLPSKKNILKAPKRVHKAERERSKRDHMNTLFFELGKSLEPDHHDKGKASTLNHCIRLLHDLLAQVDCLRKENSALLSESHYVSIEKDELVEDNSALKAQIGKLQTEIDEKIQPPSLWGFNQPQSQIEGNLEQQLEGRHIVVPLADHATPTAPIVSPIFVMPLQDDSQVHPETDTVKATLRHPPHISRPHARYPSPSDSWPSQILSEKPKGTEHITQHSSC
ncbi:hypothetical protein ACET3Z_011306 [Daucus carota]